MKPLKIFNSLFLIFFLASLMACGKKDQTPIDEYVKIIDETTQKIENIRSSEEFSRLNELENNQRAIEIETKYADYELSKEDKEKLKNSLSRLWRVALEKTLDYSGYPDWVVQKQKSQIDGIIKLANDKIDSAKTLGEIGKSLLKVWLKNYSW